MADDLAEVIGDEESEIFPEAKEAKTLKTPKVGSMTHTPSNQTKIGILDSDQPVASELHGAPMPNPKQAENRNSDLKSNASGPRFSQKRVSVMNHGDIYNERKQEREALKQATSDINGNIPT